MIEIKNLPIYVLSGALIFAGIAESMVNRKNAPEIRVCG
jgi:hypothetical protein